MNILKISIAFLAIFGCNYVPPKPNAKNYIFARNDSTDSVLISFRNILDQSILIFYQFGVSTENEEMPLKYILEKDSICIVNPQNSIVRKQYLRNFNSLNDSLFGYFYKPGFQLTKFYIPNNVVRMCVEIEPNPSQILVKAIDNEFKDRFDSMSILIKREQKLVYPNTFHSNVSKKEKFIFTKIQLSEDLIFIKYNIYPNEILQIELNVFNKNSDYSNDYIIEYQPFTKTILEVY